MCTIWGIGQNHVTFGRLFQFLPICRSVNVWYRIRCIFYIQGSCYIQSSLISTLQNTLFATPLMVYHLIFFRNFWHVIKCFVLNFSRQIMIRFLHITSSYWTQKTMWHVDKVWNFWANCCWIDIILRLVFIVNVIFYITKQSLMSLSSHRLWPSTYRIRIIWNLWWICWRRNREIFNSKPSTFSKWVLLNMTLWIVLEKLYNVPL